MIDAGAIFVPRIRNGLRVPGPKDDLSVYGDLRYTWYDMVGICIYYDQIQYWKYQRRNILDVFLFFIKYK